MNKELRIEFTNIMNRLSGKEYIINMIAFGVAPTLRGLKPSCILTLKKQRKNIYTFWNLYKEQICNELGLEFYELIVRPESITVIFYRKGQLENHLNEVDNEKYLNKLGYHKQLTFEDKLKLLQVRYSFTCPHEMGIFLGIPVEDVCGFMKNEGKNCILCRYWKVYHEPQKAEMLFENFDNARKIVIQEIVDRYKIA